MTGLEFGTLGNCQWAFFRTTAPSLMAQLALLAAKNPMTEEVAV